MLLAINFKQSQILLHAKENANRDTTESHILQFFATTNHVLSFLLLQIFLYRDDSQRLNHRFKLRCSLASDKSFTILLTTIVISSLLIFVGHSSVEYRFLSIDSCKLTCKVAARNMVSVKFIKNTRGLHDRLCFDTFTTFLECLFLNVFFGHRRIKIGL